MFSVSNRIGRNSAQHEVPGLHRVVATTKATQGWETKPQRQPAAAGRQKETKGTRLGLGDTAAVAVKGRLFHGVGCSK